MAIRKRGNRWQADVTVRGQRLPRFSFRTYEEAQAWEMEARAAALVGKPAPQPSNGHTATSRGRRASTAWTLRFALDEALSAVWKGSPSERNNTSIARQLCDHFGEDLSLTDLDEEAIDGFVQACRDQNLRGQTINHKLVVLSKTLKLAKRRRAIDRVPHIERESVKGGRIRYLTEEEEARVRALYQAWGQTDHANAFTVFVDTGLRMSELWNLEARDVNMSTGMIELWQTKTSRPRAVPMTTRVKTILADRAKRYPKGYLWQPDVPRKTLDQHSISTWERIRAHLGMENDPGFVRYITRHTCASRLVQRGISLPVVKEWMGHTTIVTTMRYAHLAPANLSAAVKALEQQDAAE